MRFLHEEAKDLLKVHRRKEPAACPILRLLRRFRDVGDEFPSVQDMLKRLRHIRNAAFEALGGLSSEDLRKPVRDWWSHASDSCMRTIWHTMTHVRQIWLLRGAMGWRDGQSWPDQHWA